MSGSSSRPSKRQRPDDGGSYHDAIPFFDDLYVVHAREGRLRTVARDTVWTAPAERSPHHTSDPTWTSATSWGEPLDDPELALDPNSDWYDEAVGGEVMQTNGDIPTVASLKKQKRSKVSVSNGFFWSTSLGLRKSISDGHTLSGRTCIDNHIWRKSSVGLGEGTSKGQRIAQTASFVGLRQEFPNTAVWSA